MLRYQEGSASTEPREKGFLEGIAKARIRHHSRLVRPVRRRRRATRRSARRRTCSTATAARSTASSVRTNRPRPACCSRCRISASAGKVKFVGFDSSQVFLDAMKRKEMDGFVLQNPFEMGYRAVKTMVAHLRGEQVPAVIDTGVTIVTPENLDTEAIEGAPHSADRRVSAVGQAQVSAARRRPRPCLSLRPKRADADADRHQEALRCRPVALDGVDARAASRAKSMR